MSVDMKRPLLLGIKPGDAIIIADAAGTDVSVGKCTDVGSVSFAALCTRRGRRRFLYSVGRECGDTDVARLATDEEARAATHAITDRREREREAEYKAQEERNQREYEALPEAAKLARTLGNFCDAYGELTLAQAPIEHLRGLCAWIKERKTNEH